MSVMACVISEKFAVVAAEGRVIRKGEIFDKRRDKTFKILNGKVIGASTGLMEFTKIEIRDHLANILKGKEEALNTLEKVAELISNELKNLLLKIPDTEVSFKFRNLKVLLVGSEIYTNKKRTDMMFICIDFNSDEMNKEIIVTFEKNKYTYRNKYYSFGEPKAQAAVSDFLDKDKSKGNNISHVRNILKNAIKEGIKHSGPSDQNKDLAACGGGVSTKNLSL